MLALVYFSVSTNGPSFPVVGRQEVVATVMTLSTSVVVGELRAQEMGCQGACLLAIILAS